MLGLSGTWQPETPTVLSPTNRSPQQQRWGGVDKRKKRPRVSSRDETSVDGMEDDSDQPGESEPKVTFTSASTSRRPLCTLLPLPLFRDLALPPSFLCTPSPLSFGFCVMYLVNSSSNWYHIFFRAYEYLHAAVKVLYSGVYSLAPISAAGT